MSRTLLITGGAGFIGSNFLRLAHQSTDDRFVVVDDLTYAGHLASISDLLPSPRVKFIKANIADATCMAEIFQEEPVSIVVHFAAESHVDRSILSPLPFIRTNIEGTFNLLEAARNTWHDPENHLFLHVSSDEVFGSLGPHEKPFSLKSPYRPHNPYAASKASADHLVRAWNATLNLPVVISNCTNNYGPWQFPEKLIPLLILNALEDKPMPLYGDGLNIRDWIHVEDHCYALMAMIERGKAGQTYLVSAGEEHTNKDIAAMICDSADAFLKRPAGSSRKLITYVKDRPGHDRRYALDNSGTCKSLGWKPKHKVAKTLPLLVEWYASHKKWADEIRSGEYLTFYEKQYGATDSTRQFSAGLA